MRAFAILVAAVIGLQPSMALSDAATHRFEVSSAKTMEADCGGGSCSSACVIKADLTNVSSTGVPPLEVLLRYRHPFAEAGADLSGLSFSYPATRRGEVAQTTASALGSACGDLVIERVEVLCPETPDRCPSFIYVEIRKSQSPQLKEAKVEGK